MPSAAWHSIYEKFEVCELMQLQKVQASSKIQSVFIGYQGRKSVGRLRILIALQELQDDFKQYVGESNEQLSTQFRAGSCAALTAHGSDRGT